MAQRAETTSRAVWRHRRKGETITRWMGKPIARRRLPVVQARMRPSSVSGGSQGRSAWVSHIGTATSIRSPWRMTTKFCTAVEASIATAAALRSNGKRTRSHSFSALLYMYMAFLQITPSLCNNLILYHICVC